MVLASLVLLLSCSLAVIAFPVAEHAIDLVKADIANITANINKLDILIGSYLKTGGPILEALPVHHSTVDLINNVNKAIVDVQNTGTIGDADGTFILDSVQAIQPEILRLLHEIVINQDAFTAFPFGVGHTLAVDDLTALNTSISAFGNALIAAVPANIQGPGRTIKSTFDAAFADVMAAFAGLV